MISYIAGHGEQIWIAFSSHITLFLSSMAISIILGLLLGIFIATGGGKGFGRSLLTILGASQATPSIAVVAFSFLFVGIGKAPAILALVIYCLVPVVFNVVSGLLGVPGEVVEAAKGIGMTRAQILLKVKLPLASEVIMSGVRSAATINIGTATVAAVIGGGGLGDIIFTGLKMQNNGAILVGAGLSAILALVVDFIFASVEKKVVPKGLSQGR